MYQLLHVILSFVIRRLFINTLGVTYLGYNAVFLNILSALNLAELGVATAITSFLYKPLAENDQETVKAIMHIFKRFYRIISLVVAIAGFGVSFFLGYFLSDASHDIWYLRFLFYLNLASTVATYFLAYKRTFLIANQKNYLTANIDSAVNIVFSAAQLGTLLFFPRYELYLLFALLKNFISNIIISQVCKKQYGYIDGEVDKEKTSQYTQNYKSC